MRMTYVSHQDFLEASLITSQGMEEKVKFMIPSFTTKLGVNLVITPYIRLQTFGALDDELILPIHLEITTASPLHSSKARGKGILYSFSTVLTWKKTSRFHGSFLPG